MSGVPDYALEETLDFKFTSRAFATGIPTTLAGSPIVEIYEDNGLGQITTAETLTVDFDGVTGLNNLRVVATAANGFEAGKSYQCVLSVGTVGGVSVRGEVVAQFSIQRSPVNWANVTAASTAVDLSGTDIQLCDTTTTNTDMLTAAAVNAEVDTALADIGLDHLVSTSVTGTDIANDSIIAQMVSADAIADWDTFNNTTDALEVIRNHLSSGQTTILADIATAQADLDILTGADGALIASGAITNATLAGNMEIVFETDFATNYNTTRNAWATNAQDFVGTTAADPFNAQVVAASVTGHTAQTGDTFAQLPTNFSSLVITAGGAADALVQGFLNNTIAETSADNIAANFETFYDNADALTAQTVDDVGGSGGDATAANQTTIINALGTVEDLGSGATLAFNNRDIAGATFATATDSNEAIRNRGDAAWTAGVGTGLTPLASGTAQSGTSNTIVLAAGETFADNVLRGNVIKITSGTGAGQSRLILANTLADDTCTVEPNWTATATPSSDSVYEIVDGSVNVAAINNTEVTGTGVDGNEWGPA